MCQCGCLVSVYGREIGDAMRRIVGFGAALLVLAAGLVAALPASAASPSDWYLSVGPSCGNNFLAKEPWCGPMLVVRDPQMHLDDEMSWPTNSLTGSSGPVPLQMSSRAYDTGSWYKFPPADDYQGPAYYNYTPSGLPAGDYTYKLTIDISGQWTCSAYNPKGCSWLHGDKLRYEWHFTWDGTSTITVAPTWQLIVQPQRICGTKGCAAVITYGANVPLLTPVKLQRKTAGKAWKTIQTDKVLDYSGFFFDESARRGTTYQYRLMTTDPSQQVSKPAKLKF